VFELAPSVSVVSSPYPVFSVWRVNAENSDASPQAFSGAESVLVTRPSLTAEAVRIPAASAAFVSALIDRKPLGAAVSAALAVSPDFPVHRTIALLIAQRAIVSIALPTSPQETLP